MPAVATQTVPLHINLPDARTQVLIAQRMDNEQCEQFCFANPELVIEREANGTVTITSPVSCISGDRESELIADLKYYARKHGGRALSSSIGFTLPDTAVKSPDACCVSAEQMAGLPQEGLKHFAKIVPEFIVEVVSPSDKLADVEEKVRNVWIKNGVKLAGW